VYAVDVSTDEARRERPSRSKSSGLRSLALPDDAHGPALANGTVIADRYRLEGRVGEGGMGEVYAAEHIEMGRRVAVKLVRPELATDESNLERFRREARAASRIKSPHVVTVYDFGRDAATGRFFLAMEMLEGETLGARIEREGALPIPEVLRISRAVAEALDAAHAAKIIHRDLKPENVFLERDGQVKVLDFGIARILDAPAVASGKHLTATATVVGTPAYINPEAAGRKREVVPQSDLYSLGVMMFEMLVGRLPFDDIEPIVLIGLHLRAPPERVRDAAPDAGVSEALDALVDQLLEKDPADRPESARAVVAALDAAAKAPSAASAPPKTSPRPSAQTSTDAQAPRGRDSSPRASQHDDDGDEAEAATEVRLPPTAPSQAASGRSATTGPRPVVSTEAAKAPLSPPITPEPSAMSTSASGSRARAMTWGVAGLASFAVAALVALSLMDRASPPVESTPSAPLPIASADPPASVEPPAPAPVALSRVTFQISPASIASRVAVAVDGQPQMEPGTLELQLMPGEHTVVAAVDGVANEALAFRTSVGEHTYVPIRMSPAPRATRVEGSGTRARADAPPRAPRTSRPPTTASSEERAAPPPPTAQPEGGGLVGALRRIGH
jgi:serine/threonine-protein kinase